MQALHSFHVDAECVIEAGNAGGTPLLRIRPDANSYGGLTIFLGSGALTDDRALIVGQLLDLYRALDNMARAYPEIEGLRSPVDDPTDEPTDEPVRPAPMVVYPDADAGAAWPLAVATDGDHYAYPDSLERTERR